MQAVAMIRIHGTHEPFSYRLYATSDKKSYSPRSESRVQVKKKIPVANHNKRKTKRNVRDGSI